MAKETIYIEADDEITTVIEKVLTAKDAIVAVVLPKRATVFQSVVNMKLLKKAAEGSKKRVVLISSEPSIASIAAVAGMHLAPSLTSKPAIPKRAKTTSVATISSKELDEGNAEKLDTPDTAVEDKPNEANEDTIELDNTKDDAKELPAGSLALAGAEPAKKKTRMPKIPDFSKFQIKMWLGIFAFILLLSGWFVGFVMMPKAVVTINTDTSSTPIDFDFVASVDATELDTKNNIVPAKLAEITKENSVTVPTTGEKNIGQKATGSVTFSMKDCSVNEVIIPSGTAISANGLSYLTTEDATMQSVKFGNQCRNEDFKQFSTDTVDVVAQQAGDNYNRTAGGYVVAVSTVTAFGSDMVGGTSQVIKVVSAEDVKKATEQLQGSSSAEAIEELKKNLESQQLQPLAETLEETPPVVKSAPAVDAEASELIVTQSVTYRMLGIKSSELGSLLDERVKEAIAESPNKSVRDNGLESSLYQLTTKTAVTSQTIKLQTVATLGAIFDESAIAEEVRGKKRGDIENMLGNRDGVQSVSVEYKPFWVSTTPKSAKKIQIVINEVEN